MQSAARNLLAGFSATALATLVGVLVVPVYLRLLGAEGYALIAFYLTLQGLLQVFDLGLTATVNREVAVARSSSEAASAAPLVHVLAWVAWGVALCIALALTALAPVLAAGWFQLRELDGSTVTRAVTLMAIALALRWPAGIYQSVLLGADQLERYSKIFVLNALAVHGGGAALLWWAGPDLVLYFWWQVAVSGALVLWMRRAGRQVLAPPPGLRPDFSQLRRVRAFSSAMVGVGAVGLALMHVDKVVLSRLMPLGDFGHYMLASLVAGVMYALVGPAFNWAFPRFSGLVVQDAQGLHVTYRRASHLTATALFPLALFLVVGGEGLLALWVRDPVAVSAAAPALALLAVGNALHGVMYMPYALTLARGAVQLALRINLVLLAVVGPLMAIMALSWGAPGAAAAWLVLQAAYVLFGGWATHRALAPELAGTWLLRDVGPPLVVCALLGGAVWAARASHGNVFSPLTGLATGFAACLTAWAVMAAGSVRIRQALAAPFLKSAV